MRLFILLTLALIAYAGDAKPLPMDTQAEIAKSEKAMAILKADYLKKANAEVERLTTVLQNQMKKMTQAGDLEGALILRDKIAEVSKGDMVNVTNQTLADLFKPNIEQAVVGKWKRHDAVLTVNSDFTVMALNTDSNVVVKGVWKVSKDKDGIEVLWNKNQFVSDVWKNPTWKLDGDKLGAATRIKP